MNGAMAELWARMMRPPSKRSMKTMGSIHHSLAAHRKPRSSPTMENFMNMLFTASSSLLHEMLSENQHVHAAPAEGAVGLGGRVDDRLALQIERGVQDSRHAGRLAERLDQPVVPRRRFLVYGLEAGGTVDVSDGRQDILFPILHVHDIEHVTRGIVLPRVGKVEEVTDPIHDHRGRERSEWLAELDLGVDDVL